MIKTRDKPFMVLRNRKPWTHQVFLNFGIFSSFDGSAIDNLDAILQPLPHEIATIVNIQMSIKEKRKKYRENKPELHIIDIIFMPR